MSTFLYFFANTLIGIRISMLPTVTNIVINTKITNLFLEVRISHYTNR